MNTRTNPAPMVGKKASDPLMAQDLFSCSCTGFLALSRTIHMRLESSLRDSQWCLYRMAHCSGQTCDGSTSPNMIWKKICDLMRKRRTYQKFKLRHPNAAEESVSLKMVGNARERCYTSTTTSFPAPRTGLR